MEYTNNMSVVTRKYINNSILYTSYAILGMMLDNHAVTIILLSIFAVCVQATSTTCIHIISSWESTGVLEA